MFDWPFSSGYQTYLHLNFHHNPQNPHAPEIGASSGKGSRATSSPELPFTPPLLSSPLKNNEHQSTSTTEENNSLIAGGNVSLMAGEIDSSSAGENVGLMAGDEDNHTNANNKPTFAVVDQSNWSRLDQCSVALHYTGASCPAGCR